jgi:ribonuclease J
MPSSVQVIVHRGSHQIGGSCVEVGTSCTRLLIDAGSPLDETGAAELPPIRGVTLPGAVPDAVLLSHSHADHSGLLGQVPASVPIWMTRGTSKMLLASEIFCDGPSVARTRRRMLPLDRSVKIGDSMVTALPVDHSVYGAVAFLLEAGGKRLLYSGDLRMHGRKSGMTRDLLRKATEAPLDLLLIEGTHLSRDLEARAETERDLEGRASELVRTAPGLVLAFFSPQHLDRMVTIYKATRRAGRTLVIDPYAAFVMHLLQSEVAIPHPASAPQLRVYFPERRTVVRSVERQIADKRISLDEVHREPSKYVFLLRPNMIERDFAGVLPVNTLGLYSMWSGYLQKEEWAKTRKVIERTGGNLVEIHTSGHAAVPDLVRLIHDLRPRRVVPIHTERPEVLQKLVPGVEIVEDGKMINV